MKPAQAALIAQEHEAAIRAQITEHTTLPSWLRNAPGSVALRHRDVARAVKSVVNNQIYACRKLSGLDTGDLHPADLEDFAMIQTLPTAVGVDVQFLSTDAAVLDLWSRHRTVLAIDDQLWEELGDADPDFHIPADLFQRLPYPDPFVALPQPIRLPTRDGKFQLIQGFWVTGRGGQEDNWLTMSTAAADNQQLGLLMCGKIVDADGNPIWRSDVKSYDYVWTRMTAQDGRTVGEVVESIRRRFTSTATDTDWWADVPAMTGKAVAALVYLCSTNADMVAEPTPSSAKMRGKGTKAKPRPCAVVAVGYRVGAAIRAHQAKREAFERSLPTGRHVRPHVRRAHFHTFRVGPGRPNERTQTRVKWVSHVEINMKDAVPVPVVHEVAP